MRLRVDRSRRACLEKTMADRPSRRRADLSRESAAQGRPSRARGAAQHRHPAQGRDLRWRAGLRPRNDRARPAGARDPSPGRRASREPRTGPPRPGAARLGNPGPVQHDDHGGRRADAPRTGSARSRCEARRAERARPRRPRRDAQSHLRAATGKSRRRGVRPGTSQTRGGRPGPHGSGDPAHRRSPATPTAPRGGRMPCTGSPRRRSTTS
jgi:hypothetical protein